ncbi:hypothetical protein HY994_02130 [Candidatus Micrarchaeota archaeon]|nr:hypothetical protein [Candidatus Micrarchaeota archaeon]
MTEAWLTNLSTRGRLVNLQFKTPTGQCFLLTDSFLPYFYAQCPDNADQVAHILSQHPDVEKTVVESKYATVQSSQKEFVVKVTVASSKAFQKVAADALTIPGVKETCETSLPIYFKYIMDKRISFFTRYDVKEKNGKLTSFESLPDGDLPPFNTSAIYCRKSGKYVVATSKSPAVELTLAQAVWKLKNDQTDVLFSWDGDDFFQKESAYGIFPTPNGCFVDGCIHLDLKIDHTRDIYADPQENVPNIPALEFMMDLGRERLSRVIELSKITGAKPDVVSRIAPGRLNTFLHAAAAKQNDILVPDLKKMTEQPKSLQQLFELDKGGTIYYPPPGVYHDVAKCDFSSMYPSIIVNYNLSPETLNCECCNPGQLVPQTPWHTCIRRTGVIPLGILKVLLRRLELKHLMKAEKDPANRRALDVRQKALKNILVTCFGYLGFNNFVFSNVECKEAVMLYGRHILENTKLIAEKHGLDVIYGIVDSVFVQGPPERFIPFTLDVKEQIGIELDLDDTFSTIVFPASAREGRAANRYYGLTTKDEIEARGICIRRSDSPKIVRQFQEEAIRTLITDGQLFKNKTAAFQLLQSYFKGIQERRYPLGWFAITRNLRKNPSAYKVKVAHAEAFKLAPNADGIVDFVFSVHGPLPYKMARLDQLDVKQYHHLLSKSLAELIQGVQPLILG